MADYTVNIDLHDHKRGDKWIGIGNIGPVLINNEQPLLSLSRIRMHLRSRKGSLFTIDSNTDLSPDATGVIDNATTWEAHIPEVENFVQEDGNWDWDMEFYESGKATPLTLYKGVLTVYDDISK